MSTIADAVAWSGSGTTLSLFAIYSNVPPTGELTSLALPEFRLRRYVLEDEAWLLGGRWVVEYDFHFGSLPSNLPQRLEALLQWARSGGAVVAWFGFEGSFHFEHVLTVDVANQIYAIADSEGIEIAEDQDIQSTSWQARVARAGAHARATR